VGETWFPPRERAEGERRADVGDRGVPLLEGARIAVTVEQPDDGIAVVTIDRPDALNALDRETLTELRDRLREVAADTDVRAVVLTGAGEKAFAAGADIKQMLPMSVLESHGWGMLGHECGRLLESMPKPTIAAVNGFALGGGCELALACDIRYAAETAKFGQPEISLAVIPGWGGTQRLARAVGAGLAKDLILTGRTIDAAEALRIGLVSAVYPGAELLARALETAAVLAAKSPVALSAAKDATNRALQGDLASGLSYEAILFAALFATADQKEGMAAFIEKREPRFRGR
jgi:enoyl-CoA hydratase